MWRSFPATSTTQTARSVRVRHSEGALDSWLKRWSYPGEWWMGELSEGRIKVWGSYGSLAEAAGQS